MGVLGQSRSQCGQDKTATMKVAAFLMCLVAAVSAQDDIVQLAEKLGANTLVSLVEKAGLKETLKTGGPFTVFGPTDAAFAKLPKAILDKLMADKKLLADVLLYHVVSGKVYSSQLTNEMTAPGLLKVENKDIDIRFNIYTKAGATVVTADGSPVVMADQNATNGVIHVVDRVLFPIPVGDIPAELSMRKDVFSTLLEAVTKANLGATLSGAGPFTLFAPTNAAFAKVPAATLNKLLANVTALTDVLTYHVLSGTVFSAGLSNGEMAKTVEGKSVTITIGSAGVLVNNAKVEEADVAVTNDVLLQPAFDQPTYLDSDTTSLPTSWTTFSCRQRSTNLSTRTATTSLLHRLHIFHLLSYK